MSQTYDQQQGDTCSSTKHQIVKFTHRWEIENLNFYLSDKDDDRPKITSPNFSPPCDSSLQFSIMFYPKGINQESKGYASIFLCLISCQKPEARIHWKVSIIDQKGNEQNICSYMTILKYPGDPGRGWFKYIKHEKLNSFLTNQKLTIFCEIEALVETINTTGGTTRSQNKQIESKFFDNFVDLFESRKLSDVVLVAVGDAVPEHRAHKAILAVRSPIFGAMFEHDTQERNEGRVLIEDISGDVIEELLRFVYTGKVRKLDQLADGLLIAADKYQLDQLKDICEKFLVANLSNETVLAMLIIADRHSAALLRSKSIEYISKNMPFLTETSHWKAIKDKPELYIEVLSKVITENLTENAKSNSLSASSAQNKISSFTFLSIFTLVVLAKIFIKSH